MYKIKTLVEDNFDFSVIFPEKQDSVRTASGLDFNLSEIVSFLQKQTNNFTIDNPIAKDLDDAIFKLYEKYKKEFLPQEPEPELTPIETPDGVGILEDDFDKSDFLLLYGDEDDIFSATLNFTELIVPNLIEKNRSELVKITKSKKSVSDGDLADLVFDIIKNEGASKNEIRELYIKN